VAGFPHPPGIPQESGLRDREHGVRALLLGGDGQVRREAAQRRAVIDARAGGLGRGAKFGRIRLQTGCAGPRGGGGVAAGEVQGTAPTGRPHVELAGKEIRDGRQYAETMDQTTEEKPVAIMLERAKERRRVETRIVVPKRAELVTVRVQAQFLADSRELLVITRGVTELRVTLPDYWVPCPINWNGIRLGKPTAPGAGCWPRAARRASANEASSPSSLFVASRMHQFSPVGWETVKGSPTWLHFPGVGSCPIYP